MPAYDYVCDTKGCDFQGCAVVTVVKPMTDAQRPETCACGQHMRRVYSKAPAIKVNGGTSIHHRRGGR